MKSNINFDEHFKRVYDEDYTFLDAEYFKLPEVKRYSDLTQHIIVYRINAYSYIIKFKEDYYLYIIELQSWRSFGIEIGGKLVHIKDNLLKLDHLVPFNKCNLDDELKAYLYYNFRSEISRKIEVEYYTPICDSGITILTQETKNNRYYCFGIKSINFALHTLFLCKTELNLPKYLLNFCENELKNKLFN